MWPISLSLRHPKRATSNLLLRILELSFSMGELTRSSSRAARPYAKTGNLHILVRDHVEGT